MRLVRTVVVLGVLGAMGAAGFLAYAYYATQQGVEAYVRQLQATAAATGGQLQLRYTAKPNWFKPGIVTLQGLQATWEDRYQGIVANATQPDADIQFSLWNPQGPVTIHGAAGPFSVTVSSTGEISATPLLHVAAEGTLGTWTSSWTPTADGQVRDTRFDLQGMTLNRLVINHDQALEQVQLAVGGLSLSSSDPLADYSKLNVTMQLRQLSLKAVSDTKTMDFVMNELAFTKQPFVAGSSNGLIEYRASGIRLQLPDEPPFEIETLTLRGALSASGTTAQYQSSVALGPLRGTMPGGEPLPLESLRCSMGVSGLPISMVEAAQRWGDRAYKLYQQGPEALQPHVAEIIQQAFGLLKPLLKAPLTLTLEDCTIKGPALTAEAKLVVSLKPGQIESISGSVLMSSADPGMLAMAGMLVPGAAADEGKLAIEVSGDNGLLSVNGEPMMPLPTWDVAMIESLLDSAERQVAANPDVYAAMLMDDLMGVQRDTTMKDERLQALLGSVDRAASAPSDTVPMVASPLMRVSDSVAEPADVVTPSTVSATEELQPAAKPKPKPKPKKVNPDQWLVPGINDASQG